MQDIGVWGWRTTIKSVTRGIGQHCGVVDVLFILLAFSSPPSNKRMPAHRWSWISTVSGHFAFLFDTSESIRLVVIAEPTVWLYNRLMPNHSIASMPPIAGQRRYPLKVLYTVDVALQGKNAIHDNMLNRKSILSWSVIYRTRYFFRQSRYFLQEYSEFPPSTGYVSSPNFFRDCYFFGVWLLNLAQRMLHLSPRSLNIVHRNPTII